MIKTNISSYFILLLFLLICCQEEEPVIMEVPIPTPNIFKVDIAGYVQKGPFINGTSIAIIELNDSLGATGKSFLSQVVDNKGSFSAANIELSSRYVQLVANGFYFDEVKGEKSVAQLTLFALADTASVHQINVNVLSHLEKDRVLYLISKGKSFTEAKKQAQQEILAIFGIEKEDVANAETLDISREGEDNAILLAISAILQGNNTVAELSELLANIITDIREDGKLDSESNKEKIRQQAMSLNLSKIRTHLIKRYEELEVNATIANFEQYIDSDGDDILNKDEDDTPDEFTFTAQKDVAVSTKVNSDEITIAGLKAGGYAEASVQQGKLIINNITLTDTLAKVKNGDKIKLLLTSSSQYADTVVATLTVGYLTSYFTIVTDDYKADSFSFTAQKDVAVATYYTSDTITISGLPHSTPVTLNNATLIKNGNEITDGSEWVVNGDRIALRLLSSEAYATSATATLTINEVSASFEVITDNYAPDMFSFAPIEQVRPGTTHASKTITLTGLAYPAPITIDGGVLFINGEEVSDIGHTVKTGDQITIQLFSSHEFEASTEARLDIGSFTTTFVVKTYSNPLQEKADFPAWIGDEGASFSIGKYVYAKGNSYNEDQFFRYDTETEKWEQLSNFPGPPRNGAVSFAINGKGYIGLGYDDEIGLFLKDFWIYDPEQDSWSQSTDFPGEARFRALAFIIKNDAYVGLGQGQYPNRPQDFWKFSSLTNTWVRISDFKEEWDYGAFCFSIGNKGYLGKGSTVNTSNFWEYEPATDEWTKKAQLPMVGGIGFSINNKGYVVSANSDYAYGYDVTNDTWLEIKTKNFGNSSSTGTSAVGKGYLIDGNNNFYEFTPPLE